MTVHQAHGAPREREAVPGAGWYRPIPVTSGRGNAPAEECRVAGFSLRSG